jgi:hypothetical protein
VKISVPARLRVPLAYGLAGAILAAAWLVRGGPTWWFAIIVVVSVAPRVFVVYRRGGRDSDEGALAGSRVDERQQEIRVRAQALTGIVTMIAAFVGLTVEIAIKGPAWWAFLVIFAVGALGYVFGLQQYGTAGEGVPDGEDAGDDEPFPVGR